MPLEPLRVRVARGELVVADGAWGTMLLDRGLRARAAEHWTLERPDALAAIAREYLAAGAEIINTNTFGGSPFRLAQNGIAAPASLVNRRAVEIARGEAAGRAYVSASIGPTGLLLQPLGDADPGAVRSGFEEQAAAMASAGADVFCIETMTDLQEAALAVGAVRQVAPAATIIATMTFDLTPRGAFTIMGVSVAQAARGLADAGADIVGANCGLGVDAMRDVIRVFHEETALPIAVRANAGLPQMRGAAIVYPDGPERFAGLLRERLPGVAIIGGCCGTTPAHIRAMREAVTTLT